VLDEVHRLRNPSELLKIAADHYPTVRIIATGSSTLGATRKFRDSLNGPQSGVVADTAMSRDLESLHIQKLEHRFYRGGLPPFLLADQPAEGDFQEWMDSYWAKDIQELFRLDRRRSFLTFVELLLTSSGGIFEATRFARPSEVSRTTIANYLSILETTFVAHVGSALFDRQDRGNCSGAEGIRLRYRIRMLFPCWHEPRRDDMGLLWEHYVLNELHARRADAANQLLARQTRTRSGFCTRSAWPTASRD